MTDQKITVAVVDNQPVVRHGVISILHQSYNIGAIGEACGGQAGIAITEKLQPDIVILEISSAVSDDCIQEICKVCQHGAVVIFSADKNAEKILQAIRLGAKGYVFKTDPLEELQKAMQSCLQSKIYLSPAVLAILAETVGALLSGTAVPEPSLSCLTKREYEIARFFSDGKNTAEVAEKLFISPKTARNHRNTIMGKLSCKHSDELLVKLRDFFHRDLSNLKKP